MIEAHYLFGADYDDIDVVIHPQVSAWEVCSHASNGSRRLPSAPYDFKQTLFLASNGFQWLPMALPMAPNGFQWLPMAPNDFHQLSLLLNHYPQSTTAAFPCPDPYSIFIKFYN